MGSQQYEREEGAVVPQGDSQRLRYLARLSWTARPHSNFWRVMKWGLTSLLQTQRGAPSCPQHFLYWPIAVCREGQQSARRSSQVAIQSNRIYHEALESVDWFPLDKEGRSASCACSRPELQRHRLR